ncbi:MAG: MerR family transcriptional regulator [Clostridiales bacterium]|nr:MerR family transcriptional regulator [Clostridiales bacterium]
MKDLFTIGEISRLYGINYRTLRYYDEVGLLKPECINPENNYRYYTTKQFERLNTILYLRELDIPVSKIKEFLDNKDIDCMVKMLAEQKEEVQNKKRRLELIENKIQNRLNNIDDAINSDLEVIREKTFEKRKIAVLKKSISLSEDIEYPLREVGGKNPKNFVIFLGKVGVSVSLKDLKKENYGVYSGIFIFLENEDKYEGNIEVLPESKYLTLRFRGTHNDTPEYYRKMFKYMKEKGFEPNGDALEISLMDYCLTNDLSKYVIELQIPYKKR